MPLRRTPGVERVGAGDALSPTLAIVGLHAEQRAPHALTRFRASCGRATPAAGGHGAARRHEASRPSHRVAKRPLQHSQWSSANAGASLGCGHLHCCGHGTILARPAALCSPQALPGGTGRQVSEHGRLSGGDDRRGERALASFSWPGSLLCGRALAGVCSGPLVPSWRRL